MREYPLTRERLAVVQVWRAPDRAQLVIAAKGAPEAIAKLCGASAEEHARIDTGVRTLAADGLRVLAVARSDAEEGALPEDPATFGLRFVGLVGLVDPVRASVPAAVAECRSAGIRVVMITGDYPTTAEAIARRAGIDATRVVTGPELARMGEDELRVCVRSTCVFARMLPEQKLRLVEALAANGEIVGMTGDGVNDAPALKAAHIGIAMGARGTDVAREAAAVVLLEDDFASLVHGVRVGRRIIDNLKKALAYILAVHLPIIGLTLVPIAMRAPLVLMPIHIAFLHLVIDPACSVVFEAQPEEADVMRRPPRNPREPLFGRRLLGVSMLQGASVLVVVLTVYLLALRFGQAEAEVRALTFAAFLVSNLALIFTNRSWSRVILSSSLRDRTLWAVTGGAIVVPRTGPLRARSVEAVPLRGPRPAQSRALLWRGSAQHHMVRSGQAPRLEPWFGFERWSARGCGQRGRERPLLDRLPRTDALGGPNERGGRIEWRGDRLEERQSSGMAIARTRAEAGTGSKGVAR